MNTAVAPSLPFGKKLIYAIGQFGWSLASFGVANLLVYFYSPPVGAEQTAPMFPVFIAAAAIIGIIGGISRIFDGITDPLIAGWSDRSRAKMGRRRKYMAIGAVPFALLSVLVFMPPSVESYSLNTIWLFISIILFYFFMTMYVTPFFALLSELGHNPDERLQLSTMISVTWALGFLVGNSAYALQGIFEGVLSGGAVLTPAISAQALQISLGIFALVALVCMMLPVLFIDENRYCERHVSEEGAFEALIQALKNRNFRLFALSDLSYWLAMTFVQTGISFYVIMLLNLDKEVAFLLMTIMFLTSFVFYVPIGIIAQKIGKKRLLSLAFILFMVSSLLMSLWGLGPIPPMIQGIGLLVFAAFPIAVFGILPNAIIADIAEADGIENGNFKAAIFFGARTLMSKLGQSLTLFIFPIVSTLAIGSVSRLSEAEALAQELVVGATVPGVRLTAIIAFIALFLGFLLFLRYDEKKILQTLALKEDISTEGV
ncbi:MFS transporter [Spirochaeta dissipatitropha]